MQKSKKPLHLESIESNPTSGIDTGSVKSAITKDGEHIYVSKGEEIPYEDGFRVCVGQERVPGEITSTYSHISQERWDAIFGNKGK
jgi:hypothetical protein